MEGGGGGYTSYAVSFKLHKIPPYTCLQQFKLNSGK